MKKACLLFVATGFLLMVLTGPTIAGMSESRKTKALARAHFSEYTGKQRDWPTSDKTLADALQNKYGVPVYQSLPNKPYEVLGVIKASKPSAIKHAVEAAQAVGADAILAVKDEAFTKAGIDTDPGIDLRGSGSGKVDLIQGILIRWRLPQAESKPPAPAAAAPSK